MPNIFKGNTSVNVGSPIYTLPFQVTFFTIANKASGSTTINVYVSKDTENISIVPKDLQLSVGDMLEGSSELVMEAGSQLKIETDDSVDYYFTISNLKPD